MLIVQMLAQAAAAAAPEAVAAPQDGVISYPPAFFAAQQPPSAFEMVQRLPGFAFDDGDAIRGFEGGGGNVLIDGQRPTSKTDNLEELLRRIPANQVERIDLIRGGAPGIDMQGRTVIANVVRTPGAGLQGVIQAAVNRIHDGRTPYGLRVEMSGGEGRQKWEGSARFGFGVDDGLGDGPGLHVTPEGVVLRDADLETEGDVGNYTLTGAYEQPLAGGQVRINARHFGEKFKIEIDDYIRLPFPALETVDENYRTFENEIGGRFNRDLGARTALELVGLHQTRDREITSRFESATVLNDFSVERETEETIARSIVRYRLTDAWSVEGGGEFALNRLHSQTRLAVNGAPVAVPSGNVRVEEKRSQAFTRATWTPSSEWAIETGLRYEASRISSRGDTGLRKTLHFIKPRASVTWAPHPATQVRVRLEREVGQLNFDDFVASANFTGAGVTSGNPDIEPQQAWVGEVSIEQRFWGDAAVVLTYRHFELSDVVDRGPDPSGAFDAPANIGSGVKDEWIANLTLPLDRLRIRGGQLKGQVTWRDSEVTDPTTGESREISNLRPVEWEASFTQDLPDWRMTWGVDAFGGWRQTSYRFNSIDTAKLKTYVRPFAEWRAQPDLVIRAEIGNLTGRGLRRTRQVFDGLRTAGEAPLRIEDRDYQFGRMYYIRVRKTFGA
ncbi:MAG: TonB-dependent receptor [Phenylobacterium sp.]|nr:TonB-dependent receptor [Phenylobacterium sp.]